MCEQNNSTVNLIDEVTRMVVQGHLDYYVGLDLLNILHLHRVREDKPSE